MTSKRQAVDPRDTLIRAIASRQRHILMRDGMRAVGVRVGSPDESVRTLAILRLDREIARIKNVIEPLPEPDMNWGPTP